MVGGKYLCRVKVGYARNLGIREEVLVSLGGNGSIEAARTRFTMGTNGCNTQEEGLVSIEGILEEFKRPVAYHVGRVLASNGAVGLVVERHEGVEVAVRSRVKEDYEKL